MSVNTQHTNSLEYLTNDKILYICIENDFYRNYLTRNFDQDKIPYRDIELIDLPGTISANPNAIILLQSETQEQKVIDLSAKLKLLFGVRPSKINGSRATTCAKQISSETSLFNFALLWCIRTLIGPPNETSARPSMRPCAVSAVEGDKIKETSRPSAENMSST